MEWERFFYSFKNIHKNSFKLCGLEFLTVLDHFLDRWKHSGDRNQSYRNDESIVRGEPSITFYNKKTRQIVIFKRETKIFTTAYILAKSSVDKYLTTGNIGSN